MVVKKRAKRYEDSGGVSGSKELYIYADDNDIKNRLDEIKNTSNKSKTEVS